MLSRRFAATGLFPSAVFALAAIIMAILPVSAQTTCTMTVTSVSFGTYIPGSPAPVDSNGNVEVRCDVLNGGGKGTISVVQNHPIYGRCDAFQDIPPGSYSDLVTVTLEF